MSGDECQPRYPSDKCMARPPHSVRFQSVWDLTPAVPVVTYSRLKFPAGPSEQQAREKRPSRAAKAPVAASLGARGMARVCCPPSTGRFRWGFLHVRSPPEWAAAPFNGVLVQIRDQRASVEGSPSRKRHDRGLRSLIPSASCAHASVSRCSVVLSEPS